MAKKKYFESNSEGQTTTVYVQEADDYTGLYMIEIVTVCADEYGGKKNDPRTMKLFMSYGDIERLGASLLYGTQVEAAEATIKY